LTAYLCDRRLCCSLFVQTSGPSPERPDTRRYLGSCSRQGNDVYALEARPKGLENSALFCHVAAAYNLGLIEYSSIEQPPRLILESSKQFCNWLNETTTTVLAAPGSLNIAWRPSNPRSACGSIFPSLDVRPCLEEAWHNSRPASTNTIA
jgi:hypothetical protein